MASVHSSSAWAALVFGALVILFLSSQQVRATHARDRGFTGQEIQTASAPETAPSGWRLLIHRTARSTPLWRMVGIKPLGAFCRRGLECSTHTCQNGHCADPQVKS